jgi:hypothetical protein
MESFMDDEMEMIWKEIDMAYSRDHPGVYLEGWR